MLEYHTKRQTKESVFASGLYISDSGLYISASGLYISDSGLYISDSGLYISASGLYISDLGFYISDLGLYISDSGLYISDSGLYISDLGLDNSDSGLDNSDSGLYISDSSLMNLEGFFIGAARLLKRIWGLFYRRCAGLALLKEFGGTSSPKPPLKASCFAPFRLRRPLRRRFWVVTKPTNPLAARST
jgi:hypothetical protein